MGKFLLFQRFGGYQIMVCFLSHPALLPEYIQLNTKSYMLHIAEGLDLSMV